MTSVPVERILEMIKYAEGMYAHRWRTGDVNGATYWHGYEKALKELLIDESQGPRLEGK